jgi:hypothetical protein
MADSKLIAIASSSARKFVEESELDYWLGIGWKLYEEPKPVAKKKTTKKKSK